MGLFGSKKTGKNAKENKKENPLNVPKTAQDSIPWNGAEPAGKKGCISGNGKV